MQDTIPIRSGEEIDPDRLKDFLASQGLAAPFITVTQFPGGSSNLTYLITSGDAEYVLRRPPFGNVVKTAHDMRREFDVLTKLSAIYAPAPRPLVFCGDDSVIGSEFYIMERRGGLIIRGSIGQSHLRERVGSAEFTKFETSKEYQREVCSSFINNLAELHSLDYEPAGLGSLGKPEGYVRRQVEGWTKRYFNAKTDDWMELERAIRWLNDNIPAESGAALIHNDYKFDNVMLDPDNLTSIVAVLDWEMVTIGDPLMDLGTTLGYWMSSDAGEEMLSMPFNPRVLMETVSRTELAAMYADASHRDVSNMLFYYIFGTFKIAVIAQQIYARWVKGVTKDQRFANFQHFVGALGRIASEAINAGSI